MRQNATDASSCVTPPEPGEIRGSSWRAERGPAFFYSKSEGLAGSGSLCCPSTQGFSSLNLCYHNQVPVQGFSHFADVPTKCQRPQNLQVCLFIINIMMRCNRVGNVENIGGAFWKSVSLKLCISM